MAKAFPGSGPEIEAQYERAGHWFLAAMYGRQKSQDWCDRKGVIITRAASEGIGSAGGFLVPSEVEHAILDLRDSFGAFRRRACVWPMGSDSSRFPRRTGTASAFFIGEGATASSTSVNMDSVELVAKKLGALVTLSSELDADAMVDMVDYIATELAWALAAKEDDCAFNGDGTSTYGGMRGIGPIALDGAHAAAKVTAGASTFGTLTAGDLASLMMQVRATAYPRAAWYASVTGMALTFSRLAISAGGELTMGMADGIPTPFFNGFPVILTQKLPLVATTLSGKAMMAFGDMYAGAVMGQRRGLTVKRSDERYFDTDQIGILVTERFDAVIHDMGDATNAGSLAVLVGA